MNISDKLLSPLPTPWTRLSPPLRRRSSKPRPHRSCSLIRTKVNKVNDNFTYDPSMYLCEFYFSSMRIQLWRFLHLWLLSVLYRSVGHVFPHIVSSHSSRHPVNVIWIIFIEYEYPHCKFNLPMIDTSCLWTPHKCYLTIVSCPRPVGSDKYLVFNLQQLWSQSAHVQ